LAGSVIRLPLPYLLLSAILVAALAGTGHPRPVQADCAFPFAPSTYEDLKSRRLYLQAIDLASFNLLFPGDLYFGLPDLEYGMRGNRLKAPGKIPPTILKAVSWIESGMTQAATDLPFGAVGQSLVSFDCGYGATQVTSGMTFPAGEDGRGSPQQALVATNFAYNIARGAWILADKWNSAPEEKPIAGVDTNGLPAIAENWYYAVWSYNGFTGPGSNRSNHPMDPIYGQWPRPPYSCGPQGDLKGHNRGNYPYQELVFGCAGSPPLVDGAPLWQPLQLTLPDLSKDPWRSALKLANFVFPYVNLDIPTPQPFHLDPTPQPDPNLRAAVLGAPRLALDVSDVKIGVAAGSGSTVGTVQISNPGTGVLAWYATPSEPWLIVQPYAGAGVGADLPCAPASPCDRMGHLQISVDAARAPPGNRQALVRVQALGTNQAMTVNVSVSQVVRLGVAGVTKN
jgi:hypothetical protein